MNKWRLISISDLAFEGTNVCVNEAKVIALLATTMDPY